MIRSIRRFAIEAEDRLKYSRLVRDMFGQYKRLTNFPPDPGDHQAIARSIARLCTAANLASGADVEMNVVSKLHKYILSIDPYAVDWKEFAPDVENRRLPRAAILKPWISARERGVIFVAFEIEWIRLLRHCNLKEFAERYTLVVAPSWSPFNLINFVFPSASPTPVFSLISHAEDAAIIPNISPNYRVVPLYASHWVDPALYTPLRFQERDIDIVMIANFAKFKRHHAFFKALGKMTPSVRVLLIGQNQDGRTAETILSEARDYGVERRFTVVSNAAHEAVIDALCRSKVSVLLSRREGSAVVVAESLFADTPTALLEDAYIGSRAFINESTGRLLRDRDLAGQLMDFLSRSHEYSPRRWAEANISCHRSTAVLNAILKEHMQSIGQEWTRDIATLCWRPDPRLVDPGEAPWWRSEREQIRARFGVEIGPGEES